MDSGITIYIHHSSFVEKMVTVTVRAWVIRIVIININ